MMMSNLFSAFITITNSRERRLYRTRPPDQSFAQSYSFRLLLLATRCRRLRSQNHEVHKVFGKKQIESPIESHAHLLFEPGQLAQVNRPPKEPSHEAGKIHPQDVRDSASPSD